MLRELSAKFWKLKLFAALVVAATIITTFIEAASAQITPDSTLGNESSKVTPDTNVRGLPATLIDGGASRGVNLFHSFSQFNVGDAQRVYFGNPTGIENILTRVTGNNVSNIFGTLGVDGNANLFLLNPNGVVFGQNAQLDVAGSFLATTADSFVFDNGLQFSAKNPEAAPLLTVNVRPGLQFGANSGDITSNANLGVVGNLTLAAGNLDLQGQLRAGGDLDLQAEDTVTIRDSEVSSINRGNIDIKAKSAFLNNSSLFAGTFGEGQAGTVTVKADNSISLDRTFIYTGVVSPQFGGTGGNGSGNDITLEAKSIDLNNNSSLRSNTYGAGNAGKIILNATEKLEIKGGSQLDSSTFGQGNGGDITVNADNAEVSIHGIFSGVVSNVGAIENFTGDRKAGNITVNANKFSLTNGARLSSSTFGKGNAGNVTVNAKDDVSFVNGYIFSTVQASGVGKGGNIYINAANLTLQDGAQFDSSTFGKGNAGDITINATGKIEIDGVNGNFPSAIFSNVVSGAEGNAGNIDITTGSLSLTNGAFLSSSTFGKGNAGSVKINATGKIEIDGVNRNFPSAIFSDVESGAEGNAGNIDITTGSLSLTNGARLSSRTFGKGNAGNVTVNAKDDVSFVNGYIFSTVQASGVGKGGNIYINAANLTLQDGAQFDSSTFGKGNAGNITINATDKIEIDGVNNNGFSSAIFSNVGSGAEGNAGNIDITTGSLSLTNGARLSSSTSGIGNAGNVTVNAKDDVSFVNSNIFSTVEASGVGKGGNIDINAATLTLRDGAQLQTLIRRQTNGVLAGGKGDAGNITINATDKIEIDGVNGNFPSAIFSDVESGAEGNAGNIDITTGSLSLTNGARLSSSTFGQGDAGNVEVKAADVSLNNSALFAGTYGSGNAGMVTVKADNSISLDNGSYIFTGVVPQQFGGTGGTGSGNTITLEAESISLNNGSVLESNTYGAGNAGNIDITTGSLSLTNGSQLRSDTYGIGDAGDIKIKAAGTVTFEGFTTLPDQNRNTVIIVPSGIGSQGTSGNPGNIEIEAEKVQIENRARIAVDSLSPQQTQPQPASSNLVQLNSDTVTESNTVADEPISGEANNSEQAGNVKITTDRLLLDNGSITATSQAVNGGNIDLNVKELLLMRNGSQINATAGGTGSGGNVSINTEDSPQGFVVALQDDSPSGNDIIAKADKGEGGEINIYTLGRFGFAKGIAEEGNKTNNIDASSNSGDPGRVTLNTPDTDPDSGLNSLPEDVTDPSNKIDQSCAASKNEQSNEFTITGRGGLPPSPDQIQSGDAVWEDTRPITKNPEKLQSETTTSTLTSQEDTNKITPATGWVFNEKGEVTLVSSTPKATPEKLSFTPKSCPTR